VVGPTAVCWITRLKDGAFSLYSIYTAAVTQNVRRTEKFVMPRNTMSTCTLKAKFHYTSWFEAGRRQVRSQIPLSIASHSKNQETEVDTCTCMCVFSFSALMLLAGRQEGQLACKNWMLAWLSLSAARCKWFAYGPADGCHCHLSSLAPVKFILATFVVLPYPGCPGKWPQ